MMINKALAFITVCSAYFTFQDLSQHIAQLFKSKTLVAHQVGQAVKSIVIGFVDTCPITDGGRSSDIGFNTGGATVVNDGFCGHQPGDDVSFIGDVNPLTLICNFAIHLVIFRWMGSHNDGILRKRFLQSRE